jgi:hypothetical protein
MSQQGSKILRLRLKPGGIYCAWYFAEIWEGGVLVARTEPLCRWGVERLGLLVGRYKIIPGPIPVVQYSPEMLSIGGELVLFDCEVAFQETNIAFERIYQWND